MAQPRESDRGYGVPVEKEIKLTPESLWKDNHSQDADARRAVWFEARDKRRLFKIRKCSDSRGILPDPDTEVVVNYIAAGNPPPEPSMLLVNSPGVKAAVVLAHFDAETASPQAMPTGCGGLRAKENHIKNGMDKNSGIDTYIERHVSHPDAILQACISAEQLSGATQKPVLAAAQNHRDGTIYPIAAYLSMEDTTVRIAPKQISQFLYDRQYDPARIYEQGIPTIADNSLSEEFQEFLSISRARVIVLKEKYPDLYQTSKTQDPPMVVLSTNIIPFPTCFPQTAARPGRIFEVFVPRTRIASSIYIPKEGLLTSLAQIEYPIKHALENHNLPEQPDLQGHPFANTNIILIDTEHIDKSFDLARELENQGDWMEAWLALPTSHIFVSETTDGVLTQIDQAR